MDAGILDDSDELKGKYIADVGDVEQVSCPIGGKYDCLTFPNDLYRFNYGDCWQIHGLYSYSEKVLIAVDKAKKVSFFVLPSGIGGDIKEHSVTPYQCPDLY